MKKVGMLILSTFSVATFASEFTHIKLNPQFEQYLTRPKMKSSPGLKSLSMSPTSSPASGDFDQKFKSAVLGAASSTASAKTLSLKSTGDFSSPFPSEGEESLLYEEIRTHLETTYESLGQTETQRINAFNQQFNLGSQNFSGFSWQKPFGVVGVVVDRQVTPNLFGSNWLIADTFTFNIEASSFLSKLTEAGLVDMSNTDIAAFAGISFKRTYTTYHYANSYNEGLASDFSKLFLPFTKFNEQGMQKLGPEEIVKREDFWTASAGGLITTPPIYGVSLSGGVLAQYDYQQMVSIQRNSVQDSNSELYRMNVKSSKGTTLGVTASLQLDFFKLIKLTLISYDLEYEYQAAKEFTLGLSSAQFQHILHDEVEDTELKKILKGFKSIQVLEPYVVALDESSSSSFQSRGSVLIWGKLQKSKTEQLRVIKDNVTKVFYKNYSQSMRVVQNFFSRLFSAVVYKLLKLPMGAKNAALYNRQVTLEYEASNPQVTDPKVTRIDGTEQFSVVMTQSYEAHKTTRWIDKKFKNDVIWFVDAFTTLPKDYKSIIRSEQLRGPLVVESNIRVEKAGFDYLLNLSEDSVFGQIAHTCGSDLVKHWMKEKERKKLMKGPDPFDDEEAEAEVCTRDIGGKFQQFKADYIHNSLRPSLTKFKTFLTKYYKRAESMSQIINLFGADNTFINGTLNATTSSGQTFSTAFSSGQFRGLGVIDNFKRENGTRTPASIVSE